MGYRQYPIWNVVQACIYKSSKSWGARNDCRVTVHVGSSSRHSAVLCEHVTTRRLYGDYTIFTFGVEVGGKLKVITKKYMHNKTYEFFDQLPAGEPNGYREDTEGTVTSDTPVPA